MKTILKSLFLLLLLFGVYSRVSAESSNTIPVLIPLSGSASEQGAWIQQGIEVAKNRIMKSGMSAPEALLEETQGSPKMAISAFYKLKATQNFNSFITYGSGVGLALSSLANKNKIIQVGVATSVASYSSENDFNFRIFPSAELDASYAAETIINHFKLENIGIVYVQNDYGVSNKEAVAKSIKSQGGGVLFEEELEPNGTDYRFLIQKIKIKNPDLIYLAAYPQEGAVFIKQAREMGLNSKILAGTALTGGSVFLKIAKDKAEGVFVISPEPSFMLSENESSKSFVSGFKELYGVSPDVEHLFSARAYDAFMILSNANLECKGKDYECVRSYLNSLENYEGASGKITFDKYGDIETKFVLLEIQEGKFVILK